MTLQDLKLKTRIYEVRYGTVNWFTYVCIHPDSEHQHIVLNKFGEPTRLTSREIERMLAQNLKSYDEARKQLVKQLREKALEIEQDLEP